MTNSRQVELRVSHIGFAAWLNAQGINAALGASRDDEYIVDLNAIQAAMRADGEFTEEAPKSGYYVYVLVNPITDRIFYIGKGIKNRAKQHGKNARAGRIDNAQKYQEIFDVHKTGDEIKILYCPAGTEKEAYRFEKHLIFRLLDHGITNQVGGTTPLEERVAAQSRYRLAMMKTRKEWKRSIDDETKRHATRIFGSLDECYDAVTAGLTRLSQIAS